MEVEQKYFNKGLDADSAYFAVDPGAYINLENGRFGSTYRADGSVGGIESVGGDDLIPNPYLPRPNIAALYKFEHQSRPGRFGFYRYAGYYVKIENGLYAVASTERTTRSPLDRFLLLPPPMTVDFESLIYRGETLTEAIAQTRLSDEETYFSEFILSNYTITLQTIKTFDWNHGRVYDQGRNRIISFVYNELGNHAIFSYDLTANVVYKVLLNDQVVGGLNFQKFSPLHSITVIDGILTMVDGNDNQPRKINIDSCIKMNHPDFITKAIAYPNPIDFREITLIKPPPLYPPFLVKGTDPQFVGSLISDESFQFAFQYEYQDHEITVPSAYSVASRLNRENETYNKITIAMNPFERIPKTVDKIRLLCRNGNTCYVINTWQRDADASTIANQNTGAQQLVFVFYNNLIGELIPQSYILKPFDNVPIYSQTTEIARNRTFLANNEEGLDVPKFTSLSVTPVLSPFVTEGLRKPLTRVRMQLRVNTTYFWQVFVYQALYCYFTSDDTQGKEGYYALKSTEWSYIFNEGDPEQVGPEMPFPENVSFNDLEFRGLTQNDVIVAVRPGAIYRIIMTQQFLTYKDAEGQILITLINSPVHPELSVFKSNSTYLCGIIFKDFAQRTGSVVTNGNLVVKTPIRDYDYTSGVNMIEYQLSNDNALDEIPEWAWYYSIVRTLNLKTRFFTESLLRDVQYAIKDAEGNFFVDKDTLQDSNVKYSSRTAAIAINTDVMVQRGLGYMYNDGDICVLINDSNVSISLPVIGVLGNYIFLKPHNIGTLGGSLVTPPKFVCEIYTPYQPAVEEPYYEVGHLLPINNPGTTERRFHATTGYLRGDTAVLSKSYSGINYRVDAMSPNDAFWKRWDYDASRVNIRLDIGNQKKFSSISWSNTYITGTKNNGLSTFDVLNQKPIPLNFGPIYKLIVTSKIQEEGDVLLAICQNGTCAIYIEQTQISDTSGTTKFLATSAEVIGAINALRGGYGTTHPHSVVRYDGNVFWWDDVNGKYIQYGTNGLYPISKYDLNKFWHLFTQSFKSKTLAEIAALGSRPFVVSGVDPNSGELLISVPRVLESSPKGKLPEDSSINYPFDIWDGQAKSVVFKLEDNPNVWGGSFNISAEGFVTAGLELYYFNNANLYKLNSKNSQANFSGKQFFTRLMFVVNSQPGIPKIFNNITIYGNRSPFRVYIRTEEDWVQHYQSSQLEYGDFKTKEGVHNSLIYRNIFTTKGADIIPHSLFTGDVMRGPECLIMLEFNVAAGPLHIRFVEVGYDVSLGHKRY